MAYSSKPSVKVSTPKNPVKIPKSIKTSHLGGDKVHQLKMSKPTLNGMKVGSEGMNISM